MQLMQFKPHFHVEIIDREQLVLFSEDKHHLLQGSIYVAIAELIYSSPMPEKTIIEILLPKFPLECIQEALSRLRKKGFFSNSCNKTSKDILAFWSDLALDEEVRVKPSIAIKKLQSTQFF